MKALSVPKLKVPGTKSEDRTKHKSACGTGVVGVEIVRDVGCLVEVVSIRHRCANGAETESRGASEDAVDIEAVEGLHVPVVGVVFNSFNALDLAEHLFVRLLYVVIVTVNVNAVTSH